jgi:hypothetical protein
VIRVLGFVAWALLELAAVGLTYTARGLDSLARALERLI